MGSSQVITLGEKREIHAKAKFQDKFTPGASADSLHNHLGKTLIYCMRDLYNLTCSNAY